MTNKKQLLEILPDDSLDHLSDDLAQLWGGRENDNIENAIECLMECDSIGVQVVIKAFVTKKEFVFSIAQDWGGVLGEKAALGLIDVLDHRINEIESEQTDILTIIGGLKDFLFHPSVVIKQEVWETVVFPRVKEIDRENTDRTLKPALKQLSRSLSKFPKNK